MIERIRRAGPLAGVERPAVSPRVYRRLDHATKLGGLALVVAGLEAGGATPPGMALGLAGAALGTSTVFIDTNE